MNVYGVTRIPADAELSTSDIMFSNLISSCARRKRTSGGVQQVMGKVALKAHRDLGDRDLLKRVRELPHRADLNRQPRRQVFQRRILID